MFCFKLFHKQSPFVFRIFWYTKFFKMAPTPLPFPFQAKHENCLTKQADSDQNLEHRGMVSLHTWGDSASKLYVRTLLLCSPSLIWERSLQRLALQYADLSESNIPAYPRHNTGWELESYTRLFSSLVLGSWQDTHCLYPPTLPQRKCRSLSPLPKLPFPTSSHLHIFI